MDGDGMIVPWGEAPPNIAEGAEKGMGIGDGIVSVPYPANKEQSIRVRKREIVEAGSHRPTFVLAKNPELGVKKKGRIHSQTDGYRCHYCRQKTIENHAQCSKCINKWCSVCLRNRLGEDLQDIMRMTRWLCPKCRRGCGPGCLINCCNCGPCRKKQGLQPTGCIAKVVREAGFTNAHDYLVHLQTGESPEAIATRRHLWMNSEVFNNAVQEPGQAVQVTSPPPWAALPPANNSGLLVVVTEEPQQQLSEWGKRKFRSKRWIVANFWWGYPNETILYEKPEQLRLKIVGMGAVWDVGRKFN